MSSKPCSKCGSTRRSVSDGRCMDCAAARKRRLRAEKKAARDAARTTVEPHRDPEKIPEGFAIKGTSTLRDGDGEIRGQWVKTDRTKEELFDSWKVAIEGLLEKTPTADIIPPPNEDLPDDLLPVFVMGDPHLGMLAWAEETGENFDLKIGERELLAAASDLVERAPAAKQGLLINVGDFFHADNNQARTARSGHQLDVDDRYPKVLQVGIRLMVHVIELMLAKFETVIVRNDPGNHDDMSSITLSLVLAHHFHNNPRVQVDPGITAHWWMEFGNCLIGSSHGHEAKPGKLRDVAVTDQAEAWGRTKFRWVYTGHLHHKQRIELPGIVWETCRTMASKDRYAANAGYRSGQDMCCDVWHREYGRRRRLIIGVEQVRAMLGAS